MTRAAAIVATILLIAAIPGWAQARPRDEVMSNAFRCAVIGDSHQWLDCYYGAAQPARAQLGLAPAAAAQVRLVASPPAGVPGDITVRDAVMAEAFRCNGAADDRQWLDCYYGAAQPMRARLGLSPAPQVRVASAPVMPPAPSRSPAPAEPGGAAQFGMPAPSELPGNANRLAAQMASYSFDRNGIFTVALANGQVWRQLEGDNDRAHWNKPAGGYRVVITHGWIGSYNLEVSGNPGMFKVRREH